MNTIASRGAVIRTVEGPAGPPGPAGSDGLTLPARVYAFNNTPVWSNAAGGQVTMQCFIPADMNPGPDPPGIAAVFYEIRATGTYASSSAQKSVIVRLGPEGSAFNRTLNFYDFLGPWDAYGKWNLTLWFSRSPALPDTLNVAGAVEVFDDVGTLLKKFYAASTAAIPIGTRGVCQFSSSGDNEMKQDFLVGLKYGGA